jgi:hypothetical protein
MKCLSARLLTVLTALLAVTASHARADYLNWSYTSSPSVPGVSVGTGTSSASVALTDYTNQPGALSIPVVAYFTATNSSTPVNFSGSTYSLALTITDNTTHDHGTLTFSGTISGGLSASHSTLANTFSASSPASLTLDGHTYTVSIPTTNLLSPQTSQANIFATVSVQDVTNNPPPVNNPPPGGGTHGTPEPASLVLAGLGFSLLGTGRWWSSRASRRRGR